MNIGVKLVNIGVYLVVSAVAKKPIIEVEVQDVHTYAYTHVHAFNIVYLTPVECRCQKANLQG